VIVGEEVPPRSVDRAGIRLVPLVKLIDEPLVRPEVSTSLYSLGGLACPVG
jgi:hypothetical protein